jgi:hypothetical protein
MDLKKFSREEKERLYIKEMTKLQIHWGNPVDSDWDFIKEWSDEEIEKEINNTISQLKFENFFKSIGIIIKIIVGGFILLGVIGLLVFGIKQLF